MDAEPVGDGNHSVDDDDHLLAEVHVDTGTADASVTLDVTSDEENSSMLYATVTAAHVGFMGIVLAVLLLRRSNSKAAEEMKAAEAAAAANAADERQRRRRWHEQHRIRRRQRRRRKQIRRQ